MLKQILRFWFSLVSVCMLMLESKISSLSVKLRPMILFIGKMPPIEFIIDKLQSFLIDVIRIGPIPEHVAFIMDGNRTFANKNGMPLNSGHEAGGMKLLSLIYICKRLGIKAVSAYAFSIENFKRPKEEVDMLTTLFEEKITEFIEHAKDYQDPLYGSKLRIIGDMSLINNTLREKIQKAEEQTIDKDIDFTVFICLPYTSRNDIQQAIQETVNKTLIDPFSFLKVNSCDKTILEELNKNMYLGDFSNHCDILIRTSGHRRLSDFMLWQVAENGHVWFSKTLWPDFNWIFLLAEVFKWSFYQSVTQSKEELF